MNRARRRQIPAALVVAGALLAAGAAVLGAFAAWPIYETSRLWLVTGAAALAAFAVVLAGMRWRWGALTVPALILVFALLVVPVAMPQSVEEASSSGPLSLLRGFGSGIAAVALGWKQLLTLALPVGSYQTVLVPLFVLVFAVVAVASACVLRGGRAMMLAPLPALALPLFGTVFGSSAVSDPIALGPFSLAAPRELAVWVVAAGVAALWIAWFSGAERRAALKRGRQADASAGGSSGAVRRNSLARGITGALIIAVAAAAGLVAAPALAGDARTVPRDSIDPELVVRKQVSPLAQFRAAKQDAGFAAPWFEVSGQGGLPSRLRLAVLDGYDGVDFFVGDPSGAGRFTRFPSGSEILDPVRVRVTIDEGYSGVWVPIAAPLGEPPAFRGPRAADLADSFYVNREAGSAVAVPTKRGLRAGDGYTMVGSAAPDARLGDEPARTQPLVDLETMPALERWLELQELPSTAAGLDEAIERLRARGYLSHSLTDGTGERAWLDALADETPVRFVPSAGGHSRARIEQVFTQLVEQQEAAGERASDEELVAAIGDDEQFAAAAALVARAMGFESRVVLGVRLGGPDDGVPGVPACSDVCAGEHLGAWIEARGADGVWAPIDASPQVAVPPVLVQKGEQLPEFPTTPEERDASESDPPVGTANQESGDSDDTRSSGLSALWPILRVAGLGLALVALLCLAALFIPLVKRSRGRARRAAVQPEVRALGALHELADAYVDSGVAIPARASAEDTVHAIESVTGPLSGGDWIAAVCDQAVYAREGVPEETVDHLWAVVDERIDERAAGLGWWARLRMRYSLRSFVTALPRLTQHARLPRRKGAAR